MRFTSCVPLLKCNRHRNLFAIPWKSEHQQSKCEPYIMKSSVSTLSRIVAPVHLEEMELPADLDGFHAVLKRRIRDQSEIEECREDYSAEKKGCRTKGCGSTRKRPCLDRKTCAT